MSRVLKINITESKEKLKKLLYRAKNWKKERKSPNFVFT